MRTQRKYHIKTKRIQNWQHPEIRKTIKKISIPKRYKLENKFFSAKDCIKSLTNL
jgi:hypothetical protein